jgi:hypothetical protein
VRWLDALDGEFSLVHTHYTKLTPARDAIHKGERL